MILPDPHKIIVPRKHGELLVEPPLPAIFQSLADPLRLPDPDLYLARLAARQELLAAATQWSRLIGNDPPSHGPDKTSESFFMFTGHQVEFYHPGVWAKVLATDHIARHLRTSGRKAIAFDLLVDHDVVDHIGFDVPVEKGNGGWGRTREDVAENPTALPAESLNAPPLDAFLQWDARLAEYPASQSDSLAHYLSALRHASGTGAGPIPYTQWMSRARSSFERSFNLEVHHIPATWACRGFAWDLFVRAWMKNAEQWTEIYNRHLADYRRRHGIKSAQHPMPDLHRDPARGEYELPFWVSRPHQPRERLIVSASSSRDTAHIRPRALTFTLFIRLFLADLFIHGIGGALYDQITDAILQELFNTVPPYACVSAAWLLPLGQPYPPEDLSALQWRRHHIQHNPQMAIDPFTALRTEVAELIMERKHLVEQLTGGIHAAPLPRAARNAHRPQRRQWFLRLHEINDLLHQKAPRLLPNLDQQITDAQGAMEQNKVLLWREWFFALHSRQSLETLQKAITTQS